MTLKEYFEALRAAVVAAEVEVFDAEANLLRALLELEEMCEGHAVLPPEPEPVDADD